MADLENVELAQVIVDTWKVVEQLTDIAVTLDRDDDGHSIALDVCEARRELFHAYDRMEALLTTRNNPWRK